MIKTVFFIKVSIPPACFDVHLLNLVSMVEKVEVVEVLARIACSVFDEMSCSSNLVGFSVQVLFRSILLK